MACTKASASNLSDLNALRPSSNFRPFSLAAAAARERPVFAVAIKPSTDGELRLKHESGQIKSPLSLRVPSLRRVEAEDDCQAPTTPVIEAPTRVGGGFGRRYQARLSRLLLFLLYYFIFYFYERLLRSFFFTNYVTRKGPLLPLRFRELVFFYH